jgi:hypothetical protein
VHTGYDGRPEGKRPTGRPRPVREDNNKMWFVKPGAGLIWLRIGKSGGHL